MTIQEATREWFEMDGWTKAKGTSPHFPEYEHPEHEGRIRYFPTIDANYFFNKVVGRMRELELYPNVHWSKGGGGWIFNWHQFILSGVTTGVHGNIVLAGLQAAIAARKEIGK